MDTIPILLVVIVLPLWIIFHYVTRWKEQKIMSPDDETSLTELRKSAERLEERLRTMERIMDDELPGWRSKFDG